MRKLNVNTAMPRPQKTTPQAKRVAPPAIPISSDLHHRHSSAGGFIPATAVTISSATNHINSSTSNSGRSSCPGYSSIEDGGFTQTRETPAALKDDTIEYTTGMNQTSNNPTSVIPATTTTSNNKSPNSLNNPYNQQQQATPNAFQFPIISGRGGEPLTHKAAVFYHQQLALQEDQGIDLTQSPGRDSPGSSSGSAGSGSRHSTASLDSGRASSYITSGGGSNSSGSCGGTSTRGNLSSPRCSVSSCSIGSVDRMSQRCDNDIIIQWLADIKFDEYAQLFIAAGYDLSTITRMTPEDLTAIGIKNPNHRERIKQHIDNLQLPDGLPNFLPGSIEEWLRLLRLEEYIQPLLNQNYKTVRDVTQVTWEDLEDIGIVKLGHQKKILLAIKRVKDIINGKWNLKGGNRHQKQLQCSIGAAPQLSTTNRDYIGHNHQHSQNVYGGNIFCQQHHHQPHFHHQQLHQNACHNNINNNNNNNNNCNKNLLPSQTRVSWDESRAQGNFKDYGDDNVNSYESNNDIVLIKIRQPRGKSLESLEDINERNTRTHLTFSHYSTDYTYFPQHMQMHPVHQMQQQQQQQQQQILSSTHHQNQHVINKQLCMNNSSLPYHIGNLQWRRSYDDGDITPTNEITSDLNEGGGTLPRQRNSNPVTRRLLEQNSCQIGTSGVCVGGGGGSGDGITGASASSISMQAGSNILPASHLLNSTCDYNNLCGLQQENVYLMSNVVRYSTVCSPLATKKTAPEPPRRQCSVRQTGRSTNNQQETTNQQQQQYYVQQQQNNIMASGSNAQQYIPSLQHQQQQPIYVNYSSVHQTTAEIHCDKTHESKSNSSIDSIDTIPFANENTGTIKQRLLNRHDISTTSSSSSSSSTNTQIAFNSIKSSSSLHGDNSSSNISFCGNGCSSNSNPDHLQNSPTIPQSPVPGNLQNDSDFNNSYNNLNRNNDEMSLNYPINDEIIGSNISTDNNIVVVTNDNMLIDNNSNDSVNVLNDIGNMLANLTDELDAMLEEEKRVGISDSE